MAKHVEQEAVDQATKRNRGTEEQAHQTEMAHNNKLAVSVAGCWPLAHLIILAEQIGRDLEIIREEVVVHEPQRIRGADDDW